MLFSAVLRSVQRQPVCRPAVCSAVTSARLAPARPRCRAPQQLPSRGVVCSVVPFASSTELILCRESDVRNHICSPCVELVTVALSRVALTRLQITQFRAPVDSAQVSSVSARRKYEAAIRSVGLLNISLAPPLKGGPVLPLGAVLANVSELPNHPKEGGVKNIPALGPFSAVPTRMLDMFVRTVFGGWVVYSYNHVGWVKPNQQRMRTHVSLDSATLIACMYICSCSQPFARTSMRPLRGHFGSRTQVQNKIIWGCRHSNPPYMFN